MAIVFELVINYGRDPSAADGINDLIAASPPLVAGPHRIHVHRPFARMVPDAAGEPRTLRCPSSPPEWGLA